MFEQYCPGFNGTPDGTWGILAGCAYSYQALIAGVLAILAAYLAARPVWKQVRDIGLQTKISQRETLSIRLAERKDRIKAANTEMKTLLESLIYSTSDPVGEPVNIDPSTAHFLSQKVSGALDWYSKTLRGADAPEVEAAKAEFLAAREQLEATLDAAYWPEANGQSGDDYELTDEEWAEVRIKAKQARTRASGEVRNLSKAWGRLKTAHFAWEREMQKKISQLDNEVSHT